MDVKTTATAPSSPNASTWAGEGRVESVSSDGAKASIRIPSGQILEVPLSTSIEVGSKVLLLRQSDGSLAVRATGEFLQALARSSQETILSLLGQWLPPQQAQEFLQAFSQGRKDELIQTLEAWYKRSSIPNSGTDQRPAIALPGANLPQTETSWIQILSEKAPGQYTASLAGKTTDILAPPRLAPGMRGLWTMIPVGNDAVGFPALPAEFDHSHPLNLPNRLSADQAGAQTLLRWAGFESMPPEAEKELVQLLQNASSALQPTDPKPIPSSDLKVLPSANTPPPLLPKDLPAPVALRILVAWALSPEGRISEPMMQAALGQHPPLAKALDAILTLLASPAADPFFPAVEQFLKATSEGKPVLPPRLGLHHHPGADPSTTLVQHLLEDLLAPPKQTPEASREALRDTARALLGEGLDLARDSTPTPLSPLLVPVAGRFESGRIKVEDRRKNKGQTSTPEKTQVDVSLHPQGLGQILAHLELKGNQLDLRFEAREPATRWVLQENVQTLRDTLQEMGFRVGVPVVSSASGTANETSSGTRNSIGGLDLKA